MKKLVIEVQKKNGIISGRIQVQTHRDTNFGTGASRFIASNGFQLLSESSPQTCWESDRLYVRGRTTGVDTRIFDIPNEEALSKLRVAVKEYNEAFSDGRRYETIY